MGADFAYELDLWGRVRHAYGRTVVTAVNEVEAALAELRNEARHRALLVARRAEAQETRDLRLHRHRG